MASLGPGGNRRGEGEGGGGRESGICALCGRDFGAPEALTAHHLLPREHGGGPEHVARLCSACHRQVHATWSNAQLAAGLATVRALRAAPELAPFLAFVRRQPPGRRIAVRTRKSR